MKKVTFLRNLKKKLTVLSEEEVEEILHNYDTYIQERIKNGMSEEEAVASFGSVDEISVQLIKYSKTKKEEAEDPIGDFTYRLSDVLAYLMNDFSKKGFKQIVRFVFEILFLIFLLALCYFPITLLIQLGKDVFYILASPFNRIFFFGWRFVLEITYFLMVIYIFVKVFNKRYLKDFHGSSTKDKKQQDKFEAKITFKLLKGFVYILKFFCTAFLFIDSAYLVIMVLMLVLCIYLLFKGVTYFGFYLIMIALFILGILLFDVLYHFVLGKKLHGTIFFVSLFLSFLVLGLGCGLATLELADTEFIAGSPHDMDMEVLKEELPMLEKTVFVGNIADYVVNNDLEGVEVDFYYYPLGSTMATNISKEENYIYLNWTSRNFFYKKEFFEHLIADLKEKKIYNYSIEPTIIITASEKNIALIKKNRQNYYREGVSYTSCNFVRTYYVEMMRASNIEDSVYVVLSSNADNSLGTVLLKKNLAQNIMVGSTYEFTFKTYQAYIDTQIDHVFEENEVISIRETTKKGNEQKQETSCTIFY